MVKTSSCSENESCCSKSCKKNTDSLNSKITELTDKLGDRENMLFHYKLALAQVEARLAEHRNQEVKYYEKIRVLEFKVESRDDCIESLTNELELIKKEKEGLDSKLAGFQTASKELDNLLERLPEFADDTITDYTRPSPSVESNPNNLQASSSSASENRESSASILSKPEIKIMKPADSPTVVKT
nr:hypothetical protein [Tanacetum cinerariifolium]